MSTIYTAYFDITGTSIDLASVAELNKKIGLHFNPSGGSLYIADHGVQQTHISARSQAQFIEEASDASKSPYCQWSGDLYWFWFGILTENNRRTAIFEVTGRSLDGMEMALEKRGKDFVWYVSKLFKLLASHSMVMGLELDYTEAVEIFQGDATENSDVFICMGAAAPGCLASKGNFQKKEYEGTSIAVGWFPGLSL